MHCHAKAQRFTMSFYKHAVTGESYGCIFLYLMYCRKDIANTTVKFIFCEHSCYSIIEIATCVSQVKVHSVYSAPCLPATLLKMTYLGALPPAYTPSHSCSKCTLKWHGMETSPNSWDGHVWHSPQSFPAPLHWYYLQLRSSFR